MYVIPCMHPMCVLFLVSAIMAVDGRQTKKYQVRNWYIHSLYIPGTWYLISDRHAKTKNDHQRYTCGPRDNEAHLGKHINMRQLQPQHDHEGQQSGRDEHRRISAIMARVIPCTKHAGGEKKECEASEKSHTSRCMYIHVVCGRSVEVVIFPVFGGVTSGSHERRLHRLCHTWYGLYYRCNCCTAVVVFVILAWCFFFLWIR